MTLKVKKLHKTHILRFRVPNDTLRGTAVVALDRKTGDKTATSFLSGCGDKLGPWSWGQIYLWPNVEEVDVMVANTMHLGVRKPNNRRGAVAEIEILETPDEGVPPLKEAAAGWTGDRDFFYVGEQMNIGVNEATTPERWRDDQYGWAKVTDTGLSARNFKDFLQSWNRWGENAAARGEEAQDVVLVETTGGIVGNPEIVGELDPEWHVVFTGTKIKYARRRGTMLIVR